MEPETVDIWKGDLLGRIEEGAYLERYFANIFTRDTAGKSSFVLNINSEWGHGKTWFLTELSKQLAKKHPVVYFDAWKNDFTNDALLSFVSVICTELSEQFQNDPVITKGIRNVISAFSTFAKQAAPIVAATLVKQATGMALDTFESVDGDEKESATDAAASLASLAAGCVVEEFSQKKSAIKKFEESINALVEQLKNLPSDSDDGIRLPIFIFVDELDRCRPTYAIELLESIKHLFSVAGVFFVVATDTQQLSHSIKAVYGQGFNSTAYLKRFFYAEYQLAEPNYQKMAEFLFSDFKLAEKLFMPNSLCESYGLAGFFAKVAEFFKLTARDQEQVFAILKTILLISEKPVVHYILLLYVICLKHKFDCTERQWRNDKFLSTPEQLNSVMLTLLCFRSIYEQDIKKEIHIKSVFDFYLTLLSVDLKDISVRSTRGEHDRPRFKFEVFDKLLLGQSVLHNGDYINKNDLGSYFELVSQAGRMMVNT